MTAHATATAAISIRNWHRRDGKRERHKTSTTFLVDYKGSYRKVGGREELHILTGRGSIVCVFFSFFFLRSFFIYFADYFIHFCSPSTSLHTCRSQHQDSAPDFSSAHADLQCQLHETLSPLATRIQKVHALQGIIAEHDAIKKVPLLRELVEKGGGAARVGEGRVSSLVEHGERRRRRRRRRSGRRRACECQNKLNPSAESPRVINVTKHLSSLSRPPPPATAPPRRPPPSMLAC